MKRLGFWLAMLGIVFGILILMHQSAARGSGSLTRTLSGTCPVCHGR
jgi:hypothetical protein